MTIAMCPEASASGSIGHVMNFASSSLLVAWLAPVGVLVSGFGAAAGVGAGAYATADPPRAPVTGVGCPTPA